MTFYGTLSDTMAYTPRTLRRRKLLHGHKSIDPELVSLYHDERLSDSSPPPPLATTTTTTTTNNNNTTRSSSPIKLTLGTPSQLALRTRRQTDTITTTTTTNKYDHFPSIYPPSLSMTERLQRINKQDTNSNNKQTTFIQDGNNNSNNNSSFFDFQAYQMVPNKMKLALSATAQEPLFTRNNLFSEEPQPQPQQQQQQPHSTFPASSSPLHSASPQASSPASPQPAASNSLHSSPSTARTMDENQLMTAPSQPQPSSAPASPVNLASPATSVVSVATSISESVDFSLLSFPGSPIAHVAAPALSFGRVAQHRNSNEIQQRPPTPHDHGAHPLATELLTNPFLELPSSPSTDTFSSCSVSPQQQPAFIQQIIPLSTRMRQRFPNHTTMNSSKKRIQPRSLWKINDTSPQQQQQQHEDQNTSSRGRTSKMSRQRVARLRQKPWKTTTKITTNKSSRERVARLRQKPWVVPTRRRHGHLLTAKRSVWLESSLST